MTIANALNSIRYLIKDHHVYGAECILNALAYACKDEKYLDRADLHRLLDRAIDRAEEDEKERLTWK